MFMEVSSNLKDRPVSFFQKRGGRACVVFFLNLPRQGWSPAETKQASWELYPGKWD
jgi:hypothetical protein